MPPVITWKDRGVVALLVAALAALSFGMLASQEAALPGEPLAQSSLTVQSDYREGILGHPSSINPLTVRTQVDRDLAALIYRGLVHLGPNGALLPDLAQSWSVSEDGKTYRFALRPDAYWHDGVRVTSADVVFTIGLLQSPDYDGPLGVSWRDVRVIRESDLLVRFELPIARAGFLQSFTLGLLPEHVLAGIPAGALAGSDFSAQPLGNGPFQLLHLDQDHALLERVRSVIPLEPDTLLPRSTATPSATVGKPVQYDTISTLELRFFDAPAAMLNELRAGRLEAVGGLTGANLQTALQIPGVRLVSYPGSSLTAVILNQLAGHPQFRSRDVRGGLLAAIDRDRLVREVLSGHGTRAEIPLSPSSACYDSSAVAPTAYDAAAAPRQLERGGWTKKDDGWTLPKATSPLTITLLTPDAVSNEVANATARQVADDWRSIGLNVRLEERASTEYLSALRSRAFDAAVITVDLGLDPDLTPLLSSSEVVTGGSNVSGFQSQDLDKLLVAARSKTDPAARKTAQAELQRYLSVSIPILPLYFRDYGFVVSTKVENIASRAVADPSGRYWDVIDWRLAGGR